MNRIGKPLVTLRMLAAAAGVHPSTASMALHNDRRLSEETRRRLQDAAQRMGYVPNPLVAMLMSRVSRRNVRQRGVLAYLHTLPEGDPQLDFAVYRNFRTGARQRAAELGYRLDRFHLADKGMTGERLAGVWRARNIAGAVIEHVPCSACPARRLPFDLAPWAACLIGVPLADPPLHYVANDQFMRTILAGHELIRLGYRRLGLVFLEPNFDRQMSHRCSAGFWALGKYVPELKVSSCLLKKNQPLELKAWLKRHQPEAILTHSSGLPSLLKKAGCRVPEDVGLVHLDWQPHLQPAAGVYGNSDRIGAAAVDILVSQIHRGETGPPATPMNHFVRGSWIDGSTVRRIGPPLDLEESFFQDAQCLEPTPGR